MSEQKKGVSVTVVPVTGHPYDAQHDKGVEVKVLYDGHLHVFDERGEVVAVYAPGRWHSTIITR
ncbi:hypothetical protein M3G91_15445 [Micromonospora chalcea]|uniref:hypothetical protein n=1 Tax=Micromonospora chalcea TaxID=1874 RepID=UPI0021A829CC|nr:hypothetical protein [Micromonospora chalcea]MCT2279016.1 hypothetical protein [Micromonospora chalcea]